MGLDPMCLSLDATARMLHSILARRWGIAFWISHRPSPCSAFPSTVRVLPSFMVFCLLSGNVAKIHTKRVAWQQEVLHQLGQLEEIVFSTINCDDCNLCM